MFPDERTPDLLFNGVRFAELPVLSIRVTKNNTILCLSSFDGKFFKMTWLMLSSFILLPVVICSRILHCLFFPDIV